MPNKFSRGIPVNDFEPKAVLPDALPEVARPSGASYEAIAAAGQQVANTIGKIADTAAAVEGKAAGAQAGNEPGYRPEGSTTIRGRAFEQEATKQYLHNLDAKMLTELEDVYDKNKDSPAKLNTALEALHTRMSAIDVFPEVRGSFNEAFAKHATAFRRAAQSRAESQAKDALLAQSITALSAIQTTTRQATAVLDPDAPETLAAIEDGIKRTESVMRTLVANNAMTASTFERNVLEVRNGAFGDLVLQRASRLTAPDAIAEFRGQFEKDFSAGKYNGKLDGAGFDKVQAELVKLENRAVTSGRSMTSSLKKGFDDFVQREASGLKPPADEWNALTAAARDIPDGDRMVALAQGKRTLSAQLSAASVLQGDAILQKLREDARKAGGTPEHAELIAFATKYLDDERKGLRTDMLGTAQKKGLIGEITPVDFESFAQADKPADVDTLSAQIRSRAAQANAVATGLSRDPQFFRPEEVARLKEIVTTGGDRALLLASAIVRGGGDDAPAILHQIAPDAPNLAQIGAVILDGGSLPAMRDALTPAHLAATKGAKFPTLRTADAQTQSTATLGQAYVWNPGARLRVESVAGSIAQIRMARENVSPQDDPNRAKSIYERALQEAAGAVFTGDRQFGGIAPYSTGWLGQSVRTVVPPGVSADGFRDAVLAITDADLGKLPNPPVTPDGKPYSAADLQAALPVRAGRGYVFVNRSYASGGDFKTLVDRSGKPWVLDWSAIEPTIRQRRPDLFLGAR